MLQAHDRGDEEWSIVVPREEGHLASGLGPGDRGQAQGPPVIVTDEFLFRESHVAWWCATNSVAPTVANSHVFREKDVARWHQQEVGRSQISHFPIRCVRKLSWRWKLEFRESRHTSATFRFAFTPRDISSSL